MNVARLVAAALIVGLLVLAVDALSDATQNRPDRITAGTRSTVVFDVDLRNEVRDEGTAARTLWSVCAGTVTHARAISGPLATVDGWAVTVEPALGEHSRRRLVGCLEDATIDGVIGRVVELTPHPR